MNRTLFIFWLLLNLVGCSSSKKEAKSVEVKKETKEEKKPPKIKEKLIVGPQEPNETYFTEQSKKYGLDGIKGHRFYAVDINGDFKTDLVVLPEYYSVPEFYFFNGKKFKKADYYPFKDKYRASYLAFHDFNRDGILDVILGTLNQKSELAQYPLRIFKGVRIKGKIQYKEILKALPNDALPASSIALMDYNLDGHVDIYQGNWYNYRSPKLLPVPDKLFQGESFNFKDVSIRLEKELEYSSSFSLHPNARPTFGVGTCDIDQNHYPDILTASSSQYKNKLWLNLRGPDINGRKYKDFAAESGFGSDDIGRMDPKGGGNSFFVSCTDYNNDGFMDVLVGELFHSYDQSKKDRSSVLTGDVLTFPPRFIRSEYVVDANESGTWSQADRRGNWIDYNFDGLVDILIDNTGFPPSTRLVSFEQASDHGYENKAKAQGIDIINPTGTITLDLNNDGKMDFITGQTNLRNSEIEPRIYVFENNLEREGRRSIRFFLRGKFANANGLGSLVVLKTKNFSSRKWVEYINGPQSSQNEEGMYFGIGKDNRLLDVEVRWPYRDDSQVITHSYDLRKLDFRYHLDVTLCDTGRYMVGRRNCY